MTVKIFHVTLVLQLHHQLYVVGSTRGIDYCTV